MPTNKKKTTDDDEIRDDMNRDLDDEVEPGMKKASSDHAGTAPGGTTKSQGEPGRRSSTPRKRK